MREIVLECKPDEALIRKLGYSKKMITHQPNKGEVINYLKRNPGTIGIVDEDPGSAVPTYFTKFQSETKEKLGILSYSIPKLNTRLIIIRPRLEEWILRHAQESKIDLNKHSLPNDGHQLHKVINTRLVRFENMIGEMTERNNKALDHLRKLISRA